MTQDQIIAKVRSIMNETGADESLSLLSEDTVKLDEYIKSCIPDSVNLVVISSPVRCVNKKAYSPTTITNNGDGTGYVVLPTDYISLIAFKMSVWNKVVVKAATLDSQAYAAQRNPITRSGKNKPICVLNYIAGGRVLEYYSIGPTETPSVSMFLYEAKYDPTTGIDLNENDPIAIAVCYMCASLVYAIFENNNTAKEMKTMALSLIPQH